MAKVLPAQVSRPFRFELGAGASFLAGDDRAWFHDGYNVQAGITIPTSLPQLTVLATGFYHSFSGKWKSDQVVAGAPDTLRLGDFSVLAATAGLQWRLNSQPTGSGISPYATLAGGAYRIESKAELYGNRVSGSDTKLGGTFGVGLSFPVGTTAGFVEARVHNVFTDPGSSRLYPITFGIRF